MSNAQQILIKNYILPPVPAQEILSSGYGKEKQEDSSVLGWYGVSLGEHFLTFRGLFDCFAEGTRILRNVGN